MSDQGPFTCSPLVSPQKQLQLHPKHRIPVQLPPRPKWLYPGLQQGGNEQLKGPFSLTRKGHRPRLICG